MIDKIVKGRLRRNKNYLLAITGETGSGKSYGALTIAQMVDPTFNIKNVVFDSLSLMQQLQRKDIKKGSVLVFDEAGVGMSSREWQSQANKLLGFILETFRFKNVIVIFTMPNLDFLDKKGRQLIHAHAITKGIDHNKKVLRLRLMQLSTEQSTGKIYRKFYRLNGTPIRIMGLPKPSKKLCKDYEDKKQEYFSALLADSIEKMEIESGVRLTAQESAVLAKIEAGLLHKDIAKELNLHKPAVYTVIKRLEKKGIKITKKYDKDWRNPSFMEAFVPTGIIRG